VVFKNYACLFTLDGLQAAIQLLLAKGIPNLPDVLEDITNTYIQTATKWKYDPPTLDI
jgi:hypothetical protein